MRKLFFVVLLFTGLLLTAGTSYAQIRKLPSEVTNALQAKYPEAKNVEWSDKITNFTASFNLVDGKYKARFSADGEWEGSEKEITKEALPATVKDGFSKSKYADWKPGTSRIIYLPDGKTQQYFVSVSKGDLQKKNLLFNSEGQLLKDNITL